MDSGWRKKEFYEIRIKGHLAPFWSETFDGMQLTLTQRGEPPTPWISIQTRVAITPGIVFLKTAKPDLGGSLLTIGVAIVLGLASALPMPLRVLAHGGLTD